LSSIQETATVTHVRKPIASGRLLDTRAATIENRIKAVKVARKAPELAVKFPARIVFSFLLCWASCRGWCTVPEGPVKSRTIKVSVVDGADIGFTAISTLEGLSQIRVTSIVQDDLGFLWFGTQYGLNRFDGYSFRAFAHEPGNPTSLSGVNVTALFKDRNGTLWIGCERFLDRMDPKQGTFFHYPIPAVKHISEARDGQLWLSTSSGLYRLDPRTNDTRLYAHNPSDPESLHINEIRSTGEDRSGRIWIADTDGMHEFDPKTGHIGFHIPIRETSRDFSFYEDHFGVFWLFYASGHGLASFDHKSRVLTTYVLERQDLANTALTGITGMLEDGEGNLWLASQGLGLMKYERERKRFISYRHSPDHAGSLLEDRVNTLFEDKEGNIWVGLYGKGLERFRRKPAPFQPFRPELRPSEGMGCFYEDHDGNLWFGARSAVYRIDHRGQLVAFSPMKPGAALDVMNIVEDRSNNIWVGTFNHGLFKLDPKTRDWKNYRHDEKNPGSLSNDIAGRLMIDRDGTLWVATWDGLNRFDAAKERFTVFRADPSNRELQYFAIAQGRDNSIWLGTSASGLQRFDPRTGKFTSYANTSDGAEALSNNEVNSIHVAHDGMLWLSTQNGLDRVDPRNGETESFTSRDGLGGNALSCVLEDDHRQLWIATNKGVSSFDPVKKTFRNFTTADGLPGPEMGGWGACGRTSQGLMMFAGFSGSTVFRPDAVATNSYVPPVVFTEFGVLSPRQSIAQAPLAQTIPGGSTITLSHDQNLFSLAFAALSYSDPTARRYRYMLDGLDSSWNEVDSDHRSVNYTKLPAGHYRFRVQSSTSNSNWAEPGAEVKITVLPPWWNTWWFRTLYIFLAFSLIWAAYRYRMRQVARQFELRLEERVNERTRIARELHDTLLQSFQGLLLRFQAAYELLPQRPIEAKQALTTALNRADDAIVEGRDAVHDLRASTNGDRDFDQLLGEIAKQLKEDHLDNEVSLRTVVEGTPKPLQPIVQDEILSIVKEAIRNGFLHAHARHIETEIAYSSKQFRVRIRDDGRGIDPDVLARGGRVGHWGLSGIRERADRLGAQLELWSDVGAGTEVQLSVPASLAYTKTISRAETPRFLCTKGRSQ
jgi:signal transduction histidine kinase/ligand-binding sensor domain-containing protein